MLACKKKFCLILGDSNRVTATHMSKNSCSESTIYRAILRIMCGMYSYLEPTRGGKEWKKMNFDDIVAKVKECGKKTVAVSVAQDSAVLEAVHEAKRLGIADAILVGGPLRL